MEEQKIDAAEASAATESQQTVEDTGKIKIKRPKQLISTEVDNVSKIDLRKTTQEEDAIQGEAADSLQDTGEEGAEGGENAEVEVPQSGEESNEAILEEITEDETPEQKKKVESEASSLADDIAEAVDASEASGVDLPENIQKVVEFMNETGGSLEDYVRLNQDYSKLNETQLLKEYYESTKPHLDKEEIDFLMEDSFAYDEELDEERDIRKKKIAYKEELNKAKKHLDGLKSKYYEEIKAGSKLNPEQQKAVEFFNRYNKENAEASKIAEKQKKIFLDKTNKLFSNDFKGFDYSVGDKKYRFNVKNIDEVKSTQSDLNNFVKKFLNENNEIEDAGAYHKSLFTAMNPDSVAKHFYEQGKADAMKESMAKGKNIDMDPRGTHERVTSSNGWTVKAINGEDASKLRIKIRK